MVDNPRMGQVGRIAGAVLFRASALGLLAVIAAGCGNKESSPTGTRQETSAVSTFNPGGKESTATGMLKFDLNKHPMNKVVCDPFETGSSTTDPPFGVKASLHYRQAGQPAWSTVADYINQGQKSTRELFFSDLFVPTRLFDKGFATQSSEVVKDDGGNKLIEYFALKFETNLVLSPLDPEGDYELAMLADDGAVVRVNIDGVWKTIVNNDGTHPTRMGCAASLVPMAHGVARPIEISYYQGPRFHIAHMLLWKPSHPAELAKDAECGKEGNSYFFDPDHGSVPMAAYNRIYGRGWRPVPPENFMLSTGEQNYNPCTEGGIVPVISNVVVEEVRANDVTISFETDVPTAGQVLYRATGATAASLTTSDNQLQRVHRITVAGLAQGTEYQLQPVATGEDLGRAVGAAVTVTTFTLGL